MNNKILNEKQLVEVIEKKFGLDFAKDFAGCVNGKDFEVTNEIKELYPNDEIVSTIYTRYLTNDCGANGYVFKNDFYIIEYSKVVRNEDGDIENFNKIGYSL